jgi:hypothetical protein
MCKDHRDYKAPLDFETSVRGFLVAGRKAGFSVACRSPLSYLSRISWAGENK